MLKKRGTQKQYTGFFSRNKMLVAATTLIGTAVGAGMLGIPYVVAKAGFLYGLFLLVAIGIAFVYLHLFTGEVVLRTKKQYQLTGYAEKYLGKTGKGFMALSMFVNIYGALTAYLIGEGSSLYAIFKFGSPLMYTLIFFVLAFFIVYKGMKATGRSELFLISLLIFIVVLIGFLSYDKMSISNLSGFDISKFFFPYGVILFAYMASPAIPEMQEVLGKEKKKMKKAILIGAIVPIVLYIIFTFIVVGIIGLENFTLLGHNERIATVALSVYSNSIYGILANIIAVLAMFTSFLTLGTALVEVYDYDYGFPRWLALLLTFSVPLSVVLFGLTTFIVVLGITGAIAGGLDGILIMLMYWKAKALGDRKPEYSLRSHDVLGSFLIGLFSLGIIYQIWVHFF